MTAKQVIKRLKPMVDMATITSTSDKPKAKDRYHIHEIYQKHYGKTSKRKEQDMKIKKAVAEKHEAKKAEKKPTVSQTWLEVLSAAVGKNHTDEQIAQEMRKRCPGKKAYTAADTAAHRSGYNCGRFPEQKGVAPKTKLEVKKA